MTSTSFNVGLGEGRNSSRVLKPPGGGHSDIFGIHEEKPETKKTSVPPVNNIIIDDKPIIQEKEEKEQDENKEEKPMEELHKSPGQRVRVPPGGFSSGLW